MKEHFSGSQMIQIRDWEEKNGQKHDFDLLFAQYKESYWVQFQLSLSCWDFLKLIENL